MNQSTLYIVQLIPGPCGHRFANAPIRPSQVGVVTGLSSGILVSVAPAVEAWAPDDLPDRRLGGYGAILVLIGSLLQALQYVFPLFGFPAM